MEQNNINMMVNGANADTIYANIADYLSTLSKSMFKKHNKAQRSGRQISWSELDAINKEIHHQLDIIVTGDMNVSDNTAPQYESINKKKVRLTESQLHRLIKESVKRVLNEGGYYKPWWDSKYQYWHTKEDGDCDYVDFDYMSDEEIKKEYDDVLEWFRHVPCNKMACHSPDIYAKLKALEAEMEERGLS